MCVWWLLDRTGERGTERWRARKEGERAADGAHLKRRVDVIRGDADEAVGLRVAEARERGHVVQTDRATACHRHLYAAQQRRCHAQTEIQRDVSE